MLWIATKPWLHNPWPSPLCDLGDLCWCCKSTAAKETTPISFLQIQNSCYLLFLKFCLFKHYMCITQVYRGDGIAIWWNEDNKPVTNIILKEIAVKYFSWCSFRWHFHHSECVRYCESLRHCMPLFCNFFYSIMNNRGR